MNVTAERMPRRRIAKRAFDLTCATIGLCLVSPILLLISVCSKLADGGPVFYVSERIGRGGQPFRFWKFRTMVVGADQKGRAITVGGDRRITPIGHWLRKLKLDELPQLINVIRGEMSLVGPRPEVPKYVSQYTEQQRQILEIIPGITDPSSLKYRDENDLLAASADPEETYLNKIMPDKIQLSLDYAKSATVGSDLLVIVQTMLAVFSRRSTPVVADQDHPLTICLLSAEHPAQDKRVFQKEGVSLAAAGFCVIHLCPAAEETREMVDGVEIITYTRRPGKVSRLLYLPKLFARARALQADAYHCNEPDSWLVGVALRILCRKVVVFDCHEHYPGQVIRWLPKLVAPLGAWLTQFYLQLMGLLTHRIVLAKYSIADDFSWSRHRQLVVLNTTALKTTQSKLSGVDQSPLGKDSQVFTFVHIGVIRRERGSEELLHAMRILRERGITHARVVIVGEFKDGSEQDFCEKATAFGIRESIDIHHWLPFDEAFAHVSRADAGLILFQKHLSNNVRGMPHKMFDYMCASLPVIAPDFAPDIAGVLQEADAGILIDTGDPEKLADAMQSLMESEELTKRLGENGKNAVLQKYHWERDAEKLIEAYHQLIGRPAGVQQSDDSVNKAA